jgi:hypothetical protein
VPPLVRLWTLGSQLAEAAVDRVQHVLEADVSLGEMMCCGRVVNRRSRDAFRYVAKRCARSSRVALERMEMSVSSSSCL